MTGQERLGVDLIKRYNEECAKQSIKPALTVTFNDEDGDYLDSLEREGYSVLHCDIREIGELVPQHFDRVVVRYGIEDLPEGQAIMALKSIHDALAPSGRLVIGSMTAYSQGAQSCLISVYGNKQVLAGRDVLVEGISYIPTRDQWMAYLEAAGFRNIEITFEGKRHVTVGESWKGQFGSGADEEKILAELKELVRREAETNPLFRNEAHVRQTEDLSYCIPDFKNDWIVDFPIFVVTAVKGNLPQSAAKSRN